MVTRYRSGKSRQQGSTPLRLFRICLLILFLVPPARVCRADLAPPTPDSLPYADLRTGDYPVSVRLGSNTLRLGPRSDCVIWADRPSRRLCSVTLLEGSLELSSRSASDYGVTNGGMFFRPGLSPIRISTILFLRQLLPDRPVVFSAPGAGTTVRGPGSLPERPLAPGQCFILAMNELLPLRDSSLAPEKPSSSVIQLTMGGAVADPMSATPVRLPFSVEQTDSFKEEIRSNDVYSRHSVRLAPERISVSLDRAGLGERYVMFTFVDTRKNEEAGVATRCRTGLRASLRFVTYEGYVVILGPGADMTVRAPGADTGTGLRLSSGAALVLPPESTRTGPTVRVPAIELKDAAPYQMKVGGSLFLAQGAGDRHILPVLSSLHQRYRFARTINDRIGSAQARWFSFLSGRDARSEAHAGSGSPGDSTRQSGPSTSTGAPVRRDLAPAPGTASTTASSPIELLRDMASARLYDIPLFTPIIRLPCARNSFLERFAIHVDGGNDAGSAFVRVYGKPAETSGNTAELPGLRPARGRNLLVVRHPRTGNPLLTCLVPRSSLPGAREDEKRTGKRSISVYIFRDKGIDVTRPRRILKPEEVGSLKIAQDWVRRQFKQRPYRAACAGILLLAMFFYVMAKGPKQVLLALWRMLTFFRGEPCHRCGMPLEKYRLPDLPPDRHLAVASRLIYYGGSLSPQELVEGIPETMGMTLDLDDSDRTGDKYVVQGDCVWCLRCRKGQIRFTLLDEEEERETAKYPILLPHFMEFMRRWRDRQASH